MHDSVEEFKMSEDEQMREHERLRNKIRSIALKPQIAKIMTEFGMTNDPFAEENSLYEHFGFLLRCGVWPMKVTLRVISRPKWFRRSLELRRSGASQKEIFWTLTDQGRLVREGHSPLLGKLYPWVSNKIVDLFKESILSNKICSGIMALLLVILSVTRFLKLWQGENFFLNSLLGIAGFFGANGFAYNLYPASMFDERAQQTFANMFLLFLSMWLLAALAYGVFATFRILVHY